MNHTEWMPGMIEVKDSTGTKLGDTFRWKYKMAGVMFEGESTISEKIPNRRIGTHSKGVVTSDFLFLLDPQN